MSDEYLAALNDLANLRRVCVNNWNGVAPFPHINIAQDLMNKIEIVLGEAVNAIEERDSARDAHNYMQGMCGRIQRRMDALLMANDDAFECVIQQLIRRYYEIEGNEAGGYLHIVLDDGNTEDCHVWSCQERCMEHGDHLGELIAETLRGFSKLERESMYDNRWGR